MNINEKLMHCTIHCEPWRKKQMYQIRSALINPRFWDWEQKPIEKDRGPPINQRKNMRVEEKLVKDIYVKEKLVKEKLVK